MNFSNTELNLIMLACREAADVYRRIAINSPEVARAFKKQEEDCRRIADRIQEEEGF